MIQIIPLAFDIHLLTPPILSLWKTRTSISPATPDPNVLLFLPVYLFAAWIDCVSQSVQNTSSPCKSNPNGCGRCWP